MHYRVQHYTSPAQSPDFIWHRHSNPLYGTPDKIIQHAATVFSLPQSEPFTTPFVNRWLENAIYMESQRSHDLTDARSITKGKWMFFGSLHSAWGETYAPPLSIAICEQFASILEKPDRNSIVLRAMEFASNFGSLGYGAFVQLGKDRNVYGEPLAFWTSEAHAMGVALRLTRSIKSGNARNLGQQLTTTYGSGDWPLSLRDTCMEDKCASFESEMGVRWPDINTLGFRDDIPNINFRFMSDIDKHRGSDESLAQATAELVSLLDRKLSENVEVRSFNLEGAVREPVPRNLLGHLYLALSMSFKSSKRTLIRCDKCQAPIVNRKRRHALNFCDPTCRQAYNRKHR
jgi:hypothetical protein